MKVRERNAILDHVGKAGAEIPPALYPDGFLERRRLIDAFGSRFFSMADAVAVLGEGVPAKVIRGRFAVEAMITEGSVVRVRGALQIRMGRAPTRGPTVLS